MAFADFTLLDGNYFKRADGSGPYVLDAAGEGTLLGSVDGDSSTPGVDREVAFVSYRVKTAFTGAAVGETITSLRVLDVTGEAPMQVSLTWFNDSTATALTSAPSAANLEPLATGGITNAQMSALLSGQATAALQTSTTGAKTTASAALPAGGSGIIGWLSELVTRVIGMATSVARETYASVTIVQQSTSGSAGATPVLFATQACTSLDLVNNSGVDIEYQRGGAGSYMTVPNGTSRLVQGLTNASQVGIRRKDGVATAVTVQAEAFVA